MSKTRLEPRSVFECFEQITRIPRPSKKEERMIDFLLDYGRGLGLPTRRDEVGNVLIEKPATEGMGERPTVILQSHMDMVCEKNADVEFDFERDPIGTRIVEGEWMMACGTTLGADDGIGLAMQMAVLAAKDLRHGPLQCVFTRDEETGLTGAYGMGTDFMRGDYLINLDSEDEGEIFVSCAGGCNTTATLRYTPEPVPEGSLALRLRIRGLAGGHSGDDIDKKRANAIKLLTRFLYAQQEKCGLRVADLRCGGLHNAIPREAEAVVVVPMGAKEGVRVDWNLLASEAEEEYTATEGSMEFTLESTDTPASLIDEGTGRRLVRALQAVHNGVLSMEQNIDMVETSSNLASVRLCPERQTVEVVTSQRSSLGSALRNMAAMVRAAFELAGAEVETGEGYPGWKMNPESRLLRVAREQYVRLFGKEPVVRGIHAGLECGLFAEKYPGLDMVSFGPTLRGVHSPDERLLIPTVDMVWRHLTAILENIE